MFRSLAFTRSIATRRSFFRGASRIGTFASRPALCNLGANELTSPFFGQPAFGTEAAWGWRPQPQTAGLGYTADPHRSGEGGYLHRDKCGCFRRPFSCFFAPKCDDARSPTRSALPRSGERSRAWGDVHCGYSLRPKLCGRTELLATRCRWRTARPTPERMSERCRSLIA